jgi:DNA polymerase (family 10)
MELEKAKAIAEELKTLLEPACQKIEIAGSIRRRKPEVGDIELLVIPKFDGPVDELDKKLKWLIGTRVLEYRPNKKGVITYGPKNKFLRHVESGIGIDVFSTTEECWPVALVVRTGGERTNKKIASLAIKRGMRWHAYGRGFTLASGSELVCRSEASVFEAVGLPYLEPWERE